MTKWTGNSVQPAHLLFQSTIGSFYPHAHLTQFAKSTHFWYHLNSRATEINCFIKKNRLFKKVLDTGKVNDVT